VLRFELDTADLERLAAEYGRQVELVVDKNGRMNATVSGIKLLGLGKLTARVALGPIEVDEVSGILVLPIELLSFAGIKLGRKLITKRILGMLRLREWPEVRVDPAGHRFTVDSAGLLDRMAPVLAGYRVAKARFASRRSGDTLILALRS